jgi:hypothetical protein
VNGRIDAWNDAGADAELLALLEAGQTYHAVVRASTPTQPLQTPLQTFVFR